jgi:hypothetical protein
LIAYHWRKKLKAIKRAKKLAYAESRAHKKKQSFKMKKGKNQYEHLEKQATLDE